MSKFELSGEIANLFKLKSLGIVKAKFNSWTSCLWYSVVIGTYAVGVGVAVGHCVGVGVGIGVGVFIVGVGGGTIKVVGVGRGIAVGIEGISLFWFSSLLTYEKTIEDFTRSNIPSYSSL